MSMVRDRIADVLIFETKVFDEDRRIFSESYNEHVVTECVDINVRFMPDNRLRSVKKRAARPALPSSAVARKAAACHDTWSI